MNGCDLLVTGDGDGTVRLWDPQTGEQRAVLEGQDFVGAVCPIAVDGRDLLAIGGFDGTVRLWDPQTGEVRAVLEGHQSSVHGVCAITVDGRDLLASCSRDETLRVWDSETGACVLTVPTHHRAWGLAWVAGSLAVALDTGVLVIKPNLIA